jgi:glycosyltransferase involved in cell wall biosynthesis
MKHFSELLQAANAKDWKKARFHANAILSSDYPAPLKAEAQLIVNNLPASLDDIDNPYIRNMYQLLSRAEAGFPLFDPTGWLPWRAIVEAKDGVVSDDSKELVFQEYNRRFLSTGKSPIDVWSSISHSTVRAAIAPYLDPEFYRVNHADMSGADEHMALDHYCLHGHNEPTRRPNGVFCNSEFFAFYPWIRSLNINPLYIFVRWYEQFPQYVRLVLSRCLAYQHRDEKTIQASHPLALTRIASDGPSEYQRILHLVRKHSPSCKAVKPSRECLNIHLVIPDFTEGGGGHMTIFRMIIFLEQAGHACTVWVKDYDPSRHPWGPTRSATDFYQPIKADVHPLSAQFAFCAGDALLATSWDTVEIVKAHLGFHDHFYLVQDYEVCFFARGSKALLAEATYQTEIKTICAGPWLDELMRNKYGRVSMGFYLSYDPDTYFYREPPAFVLSKAQRSRLNSIAQNLPIISVAFYARRRTERRAVELALEGLSLVKQDNFRLSVELFGAAIGDVQLPDNVVGFDNGILTSKELANLYRRCDFGITFSATNYALVPQEMMACGLPVIELDNESTRAIYPQEVLLFAKPSPESIATAIEEMAMSDKLRQHYRHKALEWVRQTSWKSSFDRVEQFIREQVYQVGSIQATPADMESSFLSLEHHCMVANDIRNPVVSIVIPIYNGGSLMLDVVRQVLRQKINGEYEIILVDSSSSDTSIELLPVDSRVSIYRIPKHTFQHGRTRNLGVALSRSPLVAFLTQDALPVSDSWLANLVRPLDADTRTVAVFGRHVGHDNHPACLHESLAEHFERLRHEPFANKHHDLALYYSPSPHYRQRLHFYSDNNSCLRKEIWRKYPYPDVDYGEDQLWADKMIQCGYTKVYAHDAIVKHSHLYTELQEFERASVEAYFFKMYFGYDLSQDRYTLERWIEAEAARLLSNHLDGNLSETHQQMLLLRARAEGRQQGVQQACHEIRGVR